MTTGKMTRWGTSVPDGYTVEEYEQMIEDSNERAAKTADQVRARQRDHEKEQQKIRDERAERYRLAEEEIMATVDCLLDIVTDKTLEFFDVLVKKRKALRQIDEYGLDDSEWDKEKRVFIKRVLIPALERGLPGFQYQEILPNITAAIDHVLDGEAFRRHE